MVGNMMSAGFAVGGTAFLSGGQYAIGLAEFDTERAGLVREQGRAQVEGHDVRWMGVNHNQQTFEAHKEEIREQISEASAVVLEYFDDRIANVSRSDSADTELKNLPFSVERFFSLVAKVCAEEGKEIIVVNPDTAAARIFYVFVTIGFPMGLFMKVVGDLEAESQTAGKAAVEAILALPTIASWLTEAGGMSALRDYMEKKGLLRESHSEDIKADLLGVHFQDWRDLTTAKGLTMVLKKFGSEYNPAKPITAYHGAAHDKTLEYLRDPDFRRQKAAIYGLHNLLGDMSARRYRFDASTNAWEEASRTPITTE